VLMLLPFALWLRKLGPLHLKRNWPYLLGLIVASLFIWGPMYYAVLKAGVGISMAVSYAGIVMGMFFFGWLFLRERFTRDKFLSAVLGIIGLGLVFSPTMKHLGLLALAAALLSGLATAANMVITKQMPYNATQSTILLWLASIMANALMALVLGEAIPSFNWNMEWFYLFLFAVASVLASWTFITGVKLIEAGVAGILGLLEIVFGVLFGIALFHERPGPIVLIGVVTIIAAAAIPYIKEYYSRRETIASRTDA